MKYFVSIVLFFLLNAGTGWSTNPSSGDKEIEKLVNKLTKNSYSDKDKVEKIHDWIAQNITYDTKAYFSGKRPPQDFKNTLKTGKSLCGGYADLFKSMCDAAGVPCEKVTGYSRGYGFSLFGAENPQDGNHVWNAVKVEDRWFLVDVTWDSGYMEGKKFIQRFSQSYFLRSPAEMIFTHFPKDPKWQLLKNPVNPSTFTKFPYLNGRFFDEGCELRSYPKKVTNINNQETFIVEFRLPENKLVNAMVTDSRGNVCRECVWVNRNGREADMHLLFPKKGEWTVYLTQKEMEDPRFNTFGKIGFKVEKSSQQEFPLAYRNFQMQGSALNAPLERDLTAGKSTFFSLTLPGMAKAAFLINERWVELENKGNNVFEGNIKVPKGVSELNLYVGSDSQSRELDSIIQWQVK